MSHVPVVQGVAVSGGGGGGAYAAQPSHGVSGYVQAPAYGQFGISPPQDGNFNGHKGQKQPNQFQDSFFALLFIGHLVVMLIVMAGLSASGLGGKGFAYGGVVWCISMCALVAVGLSSMALGFMIQYASEMVKAALIFSVGCSLFVGIIGAMTGNLWMAIIGFMSFLFGCCYAYFVWARIPFAAANLRTALAGVKANAGLALVAYIFLFIAFIWSIWWSITAGSAMAQAGSGIIFLFLLSYYWTQQVIQNTVHCTTAGVIGTWWFVPSEASGFWSRALSESFTRSTTYSFGSICFGSFLVALVQALRAMHRMAHENDDCSFLICFIDCILGCIEGILEYLNKWAYVYIGLYGYSYLDAGRNVMTLFQNKGWTVIVTDDLVDNVLLMMSIAIGLFTGLVGVVLGTFDRNIFAGIGYYNSQSVGFILGFLVGFLFASVMMSVVGSAVNTVIVCFAEAPAEFQRNHPQLSNEMRMAWRQAWPTECGGL